jgi:carboxypeptidase Q
MSRPSARQVPVGSFGACAVAVLAACALLGPSSKDTGAQTAHAWLNAYRADAARLIKAASGDDFAYRRLSELTDLHGARLSGSDNLKRAIDWALQTMKADGLDNVRAEPVMVTSWTRGRESAEIVDPPQHAIAMLGLGGSVGTPAAGSKPT